MDKTPKAAVQFELEVMRITQLLNKEIVSDLLPQTTDEASIKQIREEIDRCDKMIALVNKKMELLKTIPE